MSKKQKEPSAFFCPECGSDQILVTQETLWVINTGEYYCENVKPHDGNAKAECRDCHWGGVKENLVDKTEEIEAAQKLKEDKEYQRYLKLKSKYEQETK